MNEIVSIVSVLIACGAVIALMHLLVYLDMRLHIKSYNNRHKAQYDYKSSPFKMAKKYQDWYVENFANMKEGNYDENE